MPLTRLILAGFMGLFASGCMSTTLARACQHDSDCADNEVCFVDGCGDPGAGLAVEVSPSAYGSAATQDFALDSLGATQDLGLSGASALEGGLERSEAGATEPFTSRVTFVVNGGSAVIPDVPRHFQSSVVTPVGSYKVPLSTGIYTLVVEPDDPSIPPFVRPNLLVGAGQTLPLDVQFVPEADLFKVQGILLSDVNPVTTAVLEVQAFSQVTHLPVSQRSPVSALGEFALFVDPAVHQEHGFLIQATPRDAGALVPSKSFTVPDVAVLATPLYLGALGNPQLLSGIALAPDGSPVNNATVYVEGAFSGGTFSSARVFTTPDGAFQLSTLPSLPGSALSLVVVPPANQLAGTARVALDQIIASGEVVCPARLAVEGNVIRPEGTPAVNVQVSAEGLAGPVAIPPGASGVTGNDGHFSLKLEPGTYRLDFEPVDLPRASRFVTLTDAASAQLQDLSLSKGRRVSGTVIVPGDPHNYLPALVRYFRVGVEDGKPSGVLLDESYTDTSGHYSVLLPTR
jgi:hypothetical protein